MVTDRPTKGQGVLLSCCGQLKMIIISSAFLFCVKVGDFGCADGPGPAGPHHLHQNLQFEKKETKSPTNRGERGG